jgi:hypothetical protein
MRFTGRTRPWVRLDGDGAIVTLDSDPPTAACVARRQRVMTYFVNMEAARIARRYRSLDPVKGIDVDDLVVIGATDAVDAHDDEIPSSCLDLAALDSGCGIHDQRL